MKHPQKVALAPIGRGSGGSRNYLKPEIHRCLTVWNNVVDVYSQQDSTRTHYTLKIPRKKHSNFRECISKELIGVAGKTMRKMQKEASDSQGKLFDDGKRAQQRGHRIVEPNRRGLGPMLMEWMRQRSRRNVREGKPTTSSSLHRDLLAIDSSHPRYGPLAMIASSWSERSIRRYIKQLGWRSVRSTHKLTSLIEPVDIVVGRIKYCSSRYRTCSSEAKGMIPTERPEVYIGSTTLTIASAPLGSDGDTSHNSTTSTNNGVNTAATSNSDNSTSINNNNNSTVRITVLAAVLFWSDGAALQCEVIPNSVRLLDPCPQQLSQRANKSAPHNTAVVNGSGSDHPNSTNINSNINSNINNINSNINNINSTINNIDSSGNSSNGGEGSHQHPLSRQPKPQLKPSVAQPKSVATDNVNISGTTSAVPVESVSTPMGTTTPDSFLSMQSLPSTHDHASNSDNVTATTQTLHQVQVHGAMHSVITLSGADNHPHASYHNHHHHHDHHHHDNSHHHPTHHNMHTTTADVSISGVEINEHNSVYSRENPNKRQRKSVPKSTSLQPPVDATSQQLQRLHHHNKVVQSGIGRRVRSVLDVLPSTPDVKSWLRDVLVRLRERLPGRSCDFICDNSNEFLFEEAVDILESSVDNSFNKPNVTKVSETTLTGGNACGERVLGSESTSVTHTPLPLPLPPPAPSAGKEAMLNWLKLCVSTLPTLQLPHSLLQHVTSRTATAKASQQHPPETSQSPLDDVTFRDGTISTSLETLTRPELYQEILKLKKSVPRKRPIEVLLNSMSHSLFVLPKHHPELQTLNCLWAWLREKLSSPPSSNNESETAATVGDGFVVGFRNGAVGGADQVSVAYELLRRLGSRLSDDDAVDATPPQFNSLHHKSDGQSSDDLCDVQKLLLSERSHIMALIADYVTHADSDDVYDDGDLAEGSGFLFESAVYGGDDDNDDDDDDDDDGGDDGGDEEDEGDCNVERAVDIEKVVVAGSGGHTTAGSIDVPPTVL